MGISTQTEALVEFYNQKIVLDAKQITQVEIIESGYTIKTGIGTTEQIRVYGPQELIDNYNVPIKKIDNKVLEYNNQIRNLQDQVLSLGQQANAVGCGTTSVDAVVVYRDDLNYNGYGFNAPNPFSPSTGTITSSTLGFGTITQANPVAIGSYFGDVGTCYDPELGCGCAGYATSISNLNTQITNLKALRDPLIGKVNTLKEGRISSQLQKYAYDQSKIKLNQQIQKTQTIINFLQDPANDEWL
jgi:hypothetical protein